MFSARNVLFIDGDDFLRNSMACFFKSRVRLFLAFDNAESALESIEDYVWDIIICNYHLGGMNGLEFFKTFDKATIKRKSVGVLLVAHGESEIIDKGIAIGIHDFIQEPFSVRILKDSLLVLLHKNIYGIYGDIFVNGKRWLNSGE